jgi:hypothetical protein
VKLTFSRQELLAALLFASEDESRYVLQSVCLEYRPGAQPVAVATDGVRLTIIESKAEQDKSSAEKESRKIILQAEFVRAACAMNKAIGGKLFPLILFENKNGSPILTASMCGNNLFIESHTGALVEGNYPDWRGVMPPKNQKRQPISEVGINSDYIGDYSKAAKALEASSSLVQMSLVGKEQAIEVSIPAAPNFYSLIMQCKLKEGTDYQPEFTGIIDALPTPEPEEEDPPRIKTADEEATVRITTSGHDTGEMPLSKFKSAAKRLAGK